MPVCVLGQGHMVSDNTCPCMCGLVEVALGMPVHMSMFAYIDLSRYTLA